jgi:hypothetical protein
MIRKCVGCKKELYLKNYYLNRTELMFGTWSCKDFELSLINILLHNDHPYYNYTRFYSPTLIVPTYSLTDMLSKKASFVESDGKEIPPMILEQIDAKNFFAAWNKQLTCI